MLVRMYYIISALCPGTTDTHPTIGSKGSLTLFDRFLDLSLSSLSIQDPSPAMEVRTSILRPDFYSYSRRSAGFGQALLDFSREFDITLMDSVVTALYSGSGGKEVRELISRLVPPINNLIMVPCLPFCL